MRRITAVLAALVAALAFSGAALADNCFNASRSSGGLSSDPSAFTTPVVKGNWVWLPSIGIVIPGVGGAWGFGPPANYQNSGGQEAWLLENTPYCQAGGYLFYNGPRTTSHGIQSGCGYFG